MISIQRIDVYRRVLPAKKARMLAAGVAVVFGAGLTGQLWGQFAGCSGGYCSTANIGVGAPSVPSYVNFQAIGTTGSTGNLLAAGGTANWLPWNDGNDAIQLPLTTAFYIQAQTSPSFTDLLVVHTNGNGYVGIKTRTQNCGGANTQQPCVLSVNGAIGAREIVVTNNGWSDYVFDPGYRLLPLKEVAAYIRENHHLPEIPSAAEVEEEGVSVGDMQAKLLAKIEELTLHLIKADETNRQLQERIGRLEARGQ